MDHQSLVLMLIALVLGTQLCRFLPLFIPQSLLANPILQKLNKMLPLIIMVLLVLTSLSVPKSTQDYTISIAQCLTLVSVILSYKWLKNIVLSVGLGILNINILLWLLN